MALLIRKSKFCYKSALQLMLLIICADMALPVCAAETQLTLQDAIERALEKNPELQIFPVRDIGLQGVAKSEDQRPPLELGMNVDNVAGSGDYNNTQQSEMILALSSVVELGNKRVARADVVDKRREQLQNEQRASALNVLGETTRRYIDVVASQSRVKLAITGEIFAQETVQAVSRRLQIGAGTEADALRAQAALAQAKLILLKEQGTLRSARVSLAALWAEAEPSFTQVSDNLFDIGTEGNFDELYARAQKNPAIQSLASEERLRDAELRLAKSQAKTDINWTLGAKQFRETNDTALVASVSMPLFTEQRSSGAIQTAQAARTEASLHREAMLVKLRAQLFESYQQRKLAITEAEALKNSIIPLLTHALKATRDAYESGRYSYQDYSVAQQTLLDAKKELIEVAAAALRHRADIEQLSAEPLLPTVNFYSNANQN